MQRFPSSACTDRSFIKTVRLGVRAPVARGARFQTAITSPDVTDQTSR